ncbi:GNAT family N-acetyltransferase [Rhizobium tubonense]|uniref:GNAT family N-acetyltransferase n=2 Tax=Rhizobium tubonense TaxID=484088 RepID=A0A2W4CQC3_9HYPH|nr:GNAT family N-acetyltransferase [Rhizobium tubonense]
MNTIDKIAIRESTEADDQAVGELLVRSFDYQNSRLMPDVVTTEERRADLRNQRAKRAAAVVLVGTIGGKIVGTIALYPPGADGNEAWRRGAADIRYLAIDEKFLGRGLSAPFLDEARGRAKAFGASAICLHIRRGAVGLAKLYERHGYRREPRGDMDLLPVIFLEGYVLELET